MKAPEIKKIVRKQIPGTWSKQNSSLSIRLLLGIPR